MVRREILVAEGDAFNSARIRQSRRRLINTGYFEKVEIERRDGSAADQVRLVITVLERATGQLSFGAGFSTQDGPLGTVGVQESNFLGRGYDVRLAGQLSFRASQIDASFTDKHFLGRDVSFGADVFRVDRGFQSVYTIIPFTESKRSAAGCASAIRWRKTCARASPTNCRRVA